MNLRGELNGLNLADCVCSSEHVALPTVDDAMQWVSLQITSTVPRQGRVGHCPMAS